MAKRLKSSNWRTTLGGILAGVGPILTVCPFPFAPLVGAGVTAIGSGLMGLHAADKQKVAELEKNGKVSENFTR